MWNNLTNYYFWFTQPSSFLSPEDRMFFYVFVGIAVLAILFRVAARLVQHHINRKLLMRLWYLAFSVGLSGLIWYGMRYENTYIFARRYWAGLTLLVGIVWLLFIIKYLVFQYRGEKTDYEKELVRRKYLPQN